MTREPIQQRELARVREDSDEIGLVAMLLGLAPFAMAIGAALEPFWLPGVLHRVPYAAMFAIPAALYAVSAAILARWPVAGRRVVLLAALAFAVVAAPGVVLHPGRALIVALVASASWLRTRAIAAPSLGGAAPALRNHPRRLSRAVDWATVTALATWAMRGAATAGQENIALGATIAAFALALTWTLVWVGFSVRRERIRDASAFLVLAPLLGLAASSFRNPDAVFTWLFVHQLVAQLLLQIRRQSAGSAWAAIVDHPARLLVTTFGLMGLAGGIVLSLPISSTNGRGTELGDAMFTAVSATCVTGLAVVDVGSTFSAFGQLAILVLIQIGGLGIMTFSTVGAVLLGRRIGLRHEIAVGGLLSEEGGGDAYGAARRVLVTTLVIEAVGAAILAGLFTWGGMDPQQAAWKGVFTAVAAFCNASFTLDADGLAAYRDQGLVLHVVALLIIAGGIGTPALYALPDFIRNVAPTTRFGLKKTPVSLQSQLAITTTAALLAAGLIAFAVFEWSGALAGLSIDDKLNNAWLMAVAPRTGGFHAVDYADLRPATISLTLMLMFIGGSPFSAAGGVKTTTIALISAAVAAAARGRGEAVAFHRRIAHESVYKAIAIMTMGSLFTVAGLLAIQLTQQLRFDEALFEVVSALNTVGLSMGATTRLDGIGKIIIMACMFAGRVGPLTLFLVLTERRREPKYKYPEERVAVG